MRQAVWVQDIEVSSDNETDDMHEMTVFYDTDANALFAVETSFIESVADQNVQSPYNKEVMLDIIWPIKS